MKKFFILSIIGLLLFSMGCGGGSGSSTLSSETTQVTISVGKTKTADSSGKLHMKSTTIPPEVTQLRFAISASDMTTINRIISVTGQGAISEKFEVPNGANRYFFAEALDSFGVVIYEGGIYSDLNGTPVTLEIQMVARDTTPPVFGGLSSITSVTATSMVLSWQPATDNITQQGQIQYLIYIATSSGEQNFTSPNFTTVPGASSYTVSGLTPNTPYFVIVRAQDERGNIDANNQERSATTLQSAAGTLSGNVKDALTKQPLQNVTVNIYNNQSAVIASGMTDSTGTYTISTPSGSRYRVEFLKQDFLSVMYMNVNVQAGITTYLETVLQIDTGHSGTGNVSGTIVDALTGQGVDGLLINLRTGINTTSGLLYGTTSTDSEGFYSFNAIDAGNYTAEVSGDGYITTYFNIISVGSTTTGGQDATITPELIAGVTRIVLTWGEIPDDLDSHLTGPLPDQSRFHMFYPFSEENDGSPWPEYVKLDLDDTDSYGPETTTIYQQIPGTYRFSVHDYSNGESTNSVELSNSGAQVKVYRENNLVATFNVPSNQGGTLWTVFELNGDTITPLNTMSYEEDEFNIQMRNLPQKR